MYTAFNGDAGKREIIRLAEESLPQSGGGMLHIMHKIRRDVDIHDNPVDIVLPMREHEWDKSLASFLSVFMDRREAQREKFKIFVKSQQVQPYVIARELAEGLNFTRQYNPDKKSAEKKSRPPSPLALPPRIATTCPLSTTLSRTAGVCASAA